MEEKNNTPKVTPPKVTPPHIPSHFENGGSFRGTATPKPMTQFDKTQTENKTVVGQEKIIKDSTLPRNKKKRIITAIIATFLVMVILVVVLLVVLPQPVRPSDINIEFNASASISPSVTFPDQPDTPTENIKFMPGDSMNCSYKISSKLSEDSPTSENMSVFVRFRLYAICESNYYSNVFSFSFFNPNDWYRGADNYWYYRQRLNPNEEINVTKTLILRQSVGNEFSGKTVKIVFSTEAVQGEYQAILEMWPTAPSEWSKIFK